MKNVTAFNFFQIQGGNASFQDINYSKGRMSIGFTEFFFDSFVHYKPNNGRRGRKNKKVQQSFQSKRLKDKAEQKMNELECEGGAVNYQAKRETGYCYVEQTFLAIWGYFEEGWWGQLAPGGIRSGSIGYPGCSYDYNGIGHMSCSVCRSEYKKPFVIETTGATRPAEMINHHDNSHDLVSLSTLCPSFMSVEI